MPSGAAYVAACLAVLLLAAGAHAHAVKCNTDIVASTQLSVSQRSLTEQKLRKFFETFDASCGANVEYSEFSNSVLFEVAAAQPELLLKMLEQAPDQRAQVLKEFTHPVSDGVNIPKIQDTINRAEGPAAMKKAVLRSLTRARQRA